MMPPLRLAVASRALCRSSFFVLRFRSASCHCVPLLPLAHRRCFSFGTVSLCSPLVLSCRAFALRLALRADMRFCFASRSMPSCVSPCRLVLRAVYRLVSCVSFSVCPVGGVFHSAPFCLARRSFCRVVPFRAVPDDLDEPNEKLDETRSGTRRKTRRRSRDEKRDEGREARAEKVESSYAVSLGRLII